MRIIAGMWKGRNLKSLKGDATRPTTDRVRESLMSSLTSARGTLEGATVLDAFSGSAALGLEALSRGAAFAAFCDQDREALRTIEANLALLSPDRSTYRLYRGDTFSLPRRLAQAFDVVFFDPPYAIEAQRVFDLVEDMAASGVLADDALICYEYDKKNKHTVESALNKLEYSVVSHKDYGGTSLVIFTRGKR